jgi:hypothetical protein
MEKRTLQVPPSRGANLVDHERPHLQSISLSILKIDFRHEISAFLLTHGQVQVLHQGVIKLLYLEVKLCEHTLYWNLDVHVRLCYEPNSGRAWSVLGKFQSHYLCGIDIRYNGAVLFSHRQQSSR